MFSRFPFSDHVRQQFRNRRRDPGFADGFAIELSDFNPWVAGRKRTA